MPRFVKELSEYLPQVRDVFGLKIFADSSVPSSQVDHAANVLFQYIDNDEDGFADNLKVLNAMLNRNGGMIIFESVEVESVTKRKYQHIIDEYNFMYSRLYKDDIKPEGSRFVKGSFVGDNSIEEILHMVTKQGYGFAYPSAFGLAGYALPEGEETSLLSDAARIARGRVDDDARGGYPDEAWYRRYDDGCEWECIATEYIFWGITSFLDGQDYSCMDYDQVCDDYLDTGSKIFEEWELNTPEKFKERDKALHKLLTKKKFSFPSVLPDGNYSAQVEQVENIRSHAIALPSKFKKKHVDKITGFSVANDVLQFDSDSFGLDHHAEFVYGSNFAIGSSKKEVKKNLATQDFDFIYEKNYEKNKGVLYFNENGSEKGFGDGGIIAMLVGGPTLTISNLEFI